MDLNSLSFDDLEWIFHPFLLSTKTLFISMFLFIFIGLPITYFLAFRRGKMKTIAEVMVMFPLIFPPIATGFLLLYLLGKNGLIGKFISLEIVFSFKALVIAAFLAGLPLFVKPIQSALESFPKSLIEAAQSLGKNRFEIAIFIIFPNIFRTILSSLILALARGLGEVGITLMLGGNIIGKTDTISLAIFNAVYDGENEKALLLSIVLVVLSLSMFGIINRLNVVKKL
ncbi:molybdate ABC transporter permease [Campylobacter fetus subsp. testudinum]|uniref:Molybdate ABC transporter permease n=3 Tax=Campylobacter fetus TaxID=196 RepID=A0AAX0HDJ5_CAMFE|nr:molybdate ABC transporter permease [Campylobacter fetus subsp. testudinum]OCR86405.1 molybdate ABC transporter permease [Campylobacter fetus subsp. testudinum]OCR87012.1 molybdate ABC transporter permease [Campylobacter fetus subsp. testudinum]OCR88159.1 molybdate ABC transporter permease [Campylobacter fetus subsp. testudinum]OCR91461.1 molybdate ABC transporter permease [Campylobacter fetus subsp. testudinum]